METTADLPIAQRRATRRCSTLAPTPAKKGAGVSKTPKRRSKRVRFSDTDIPSSRAISTGLTPFVRRSSLGTPRKSLLSSPISNFPDTIQFTPFRQALDDRCKRRIRRNGMSQEMNEYSKDRKTTADLQNEIDMKDAELQLLRSELKSARSLKPEEIAPSSQRVDEVEAELAQLRQSFSEHDVSDNDAMEVNWDHINPVPGPESESGDTIRIWEDDEEPPINISLSTPSRSGLDAEGMAMALDLQSARSERTRLFTELRNRRSGGVEMHFADSPARPQTSSSLSVPEPPADFYHNLSKSLKATTQRAEDAENALSVLETEVKELGFDGATASVMLTEITQQFRAARLELERTFPGETASGFENAKLLAEIIKKLKIVVQLVRDRDAELKSMRDQQRTLKGNFEHAIMAGEKANAKVKDLEDAIDQGAEEMLHIRMRNRDMEKDLAEKEKSVASLIAALNKYRDDIGQLEQLILQLETGQGEKMQEVRDQVTSEYEEKLSDQEAKAAAEETGRRAAEKSAVERLARIQDLEAMVATARRHSADVESQLLDVQAQLTSEAAAGEREVGGLNSRISSLSTALASANAEVDKLKIQNTKLNGRVKEEIEKAAAATDAMQAQFIKGIVRANEHMKKYQRGAKIRDANFELYNDDDNDSSSVAGPATPASMVRFADLEEGLGDDDHTEGDVVITRGKGKRRSRRRYDSGIGMDVLGEEDERAAALMTPDLSSEPDYAMAE